MQRDEHVDISIYGKMFEKMGEHRNLSYRFFGFHYDTYCFNIQKCWIEYYENRKLFSLYELSCYER